MTTTHSIDSDKLSGIKADLRPRAVVGREVDVQSPICVLLEFIESWNGTEFENSELDICSVENGMIFSSLPNRAMEQSLGRHC